MTIQVDKIFKKIGISKNNLFTNETENLLQYHSWVNESFPFGTFKLFSIYWHCSIQAQISYKLQMLVPCKMSRFSTKQTNKQTTFTCDMEPSKVTQTKEKNYWRLLRWVFFYSLHLCILMPTSNSRSFFFCSFFSPLLGALFNGVC